MTANELAAAVADAAGHEMSSALERMKHCLGQLSEEQVWWRPHPAMNSIGNLALHLCGNVRQWIVSGCGGEPDTRDRPGEFAERRLLCRAELEHRLDEAVGRADTVLAVLTAGQLLEKRRIQGFDTTVLGALFDSVPHFSGHTQEIVFLTRLQLGDAYQFQWVPATPEQGVPS